MSVARTKELDMRCTLEGGEHACSTSWDGQRKRGDGGESGDDLDERTMKFGRRRRKKEFTNGREGRYLEIRGQARLDDVFYIITDEITDQITDEGSYLKAMSIADC